VSSTAADSESSQIGKKNEAIASPTTMSGPTLGDPVATGDDFTTRTTPSSPPHLSDTEARLYYYGLPSKPALVARTGSTPWVEPTGLEAYPRKKELGVVGNHEIIKIWDDLVPKVFDILDKGQVDWTSIDPVRIGYADERPRPMVIWIGINPDSQVPYKVNYDTAVQCKKLLIDHDIKDVEVEMRKSKVIRSAARQ
jgi:hypothetical protein